MLFILFFVLSFILSLFILYILIRHDFVLARKSLLLQEIFDTTFFAYIAFFIVGRLAYIVSSLKFSLLNIVTFFHIFKFPGILFLGGVLGFSLVIFFAFSKKKILKRLFDIYALSMYPLFIFALCYSYLAGFFLYFTILIFLLSCFFLGVGIYSYKNYVLKDGSVALLFICLISIFTIISEFSNTGRFIFSFFTIPQVVSVFIFISVSILLLLHEGMLPTSKKEPV